MASEKPNINTLLNLAIGAGVLYGGYKLFTLFDAGDGEGQGGGGNLDKPYTDPRVIVPQVTAPPTMTRENARIQADRIYAAIYGDGSVWSGRVTEDEEAVIAAMLVPRNTADVLLIVDEYGERGAWYWSGVMNLPATLRTYLSDADIHGINMDYAARQIAIRF